MTAAQVSSTGIHFWKREGKEQMRKRTGITSFTSTLTLVFRWRQKSTAYFISKSLDIQLLTLWSICLISEGVYFHIQKRFSFLKLCFLCCRNVRLIIQPRHFAELEIYPHWTVKESIMQFPVLNITFFVLLHMLNHSTCACRHKNSHYHTPTFAVLPVCSFRLQSCWSLWDRDLFSLKSPCSVSLKCIVNQNNK